MFCVIYESDNNYNILEIFTENKKRTRIPKCKRGAEYELDEKN